MKNYPDDITELCLRCGLSADKYQTFSRHKGHKGSEAGGARQGPELWGAERPASAQNSPVLNVAPPASFQPAPARAGGSLLQSLANRTAAQSEPARLDQTPSESPSKNWLSVMSAAGGVGTTTLLATLGRIFTLRGEEVLIIDGRPNSILPLYFGATRVLNGAWTLQLGGYRRQGLLHIVSARSVEPGQYEHLRGAVESLLPNVDRVLCDYSERLPFDTMPGAQCLTTLIPDMRCFMQATRFLSKYQQGGTPHFLLNQFDESLQAHRDLQHSLARELGSMLLPFVIRRCPDIPNSLTDGGTVFDCLPHSEVAADFGRLAEWLSESDSRRPLHRAAAGLVR